jgi:hypothetical protein
MASVRVGSLPVAAAIAASFVLAGCGSMNLENLEEIVAMPKAAPPQGAKLPQVKYTSDTWHVEGTVADACQCTVFCPCEFKSLPSHGCCDDSAILHVEKGSFGGVNLDHTDVVIVSESPSGQRMIDNVGSLTFARIYVANTVSDEQAACLAELSRRVMGTWVKDRSRLSGDEIVQKVDLTVTMGPNAATAKIPHVLDLAMETAAGGDGKTPIKIVNSPWSAPGIDDVLVAHSTRYDYTTEGRDWHYGGQSASFRSFKLDGPVKDAPPPEPPPTGK